MTACTRLAGSGRTTLPGAGRYYDAGYYLVYPRGAPGRSVVSHFREWIRSEARGVVSPE